MGQGKSQRILVVTPGLDPVGTGRQVELAVGGLVQHGFDVAVAVASRGGHVARRLAALGIAVHQIGPRPQVDVTATARLARLVATMRPDAMLGFGRRVAVPLAIAKRFEPRCHTVLWLGLPPRRLVTIAATAGLDRIIACSAGVAAESARAGGHPDRIVVVPPGSAAEQGSGMTREALARRLGLDPLKQWTLAVAPLESEPRLHRLLWAIDQLGVVRKDLQHVLVGAGPMLQNLWRRGRAQELAERLFVFPTCDVLPDLVGHAKLVWQSGAVALGGALLDAMAHGLPVVAVDSDAARQLIVDHVTGRIVPALPESEFPRRAFNVLEDESLARRYGEAGAARAAAEFPADRFVTGIVSSLSRRP
jgi:glycosyltransferase involved in cell wall biosynthesis